MPTEAQLAANRANAQHSTGPATDTGKQRSSLNALKTGLTGRTVLLPGEDAALFEAHVTRYHEVYSPAGDEETALVQRLAETRWRLDRCSALEHNLFALGQVEFASLFPEETPQARAALIQAHTFRAYQKDFRNLGIQEGRLQRAFDRHLSELRDLQSTRAAEEERALKQAKKQQQAPQHQEAEPELARIHEAARLYLIHQRAGKPFHPAQFGFEFSTAQIEGYVTALQQLDRAA